MEKDNKNFEEMLEELELIVGELEKGDVPLDNAISKFNEAMKLANECNKTLEQANETIAQVINKNGAFEQFDIAE